MVDLAAAADGSGETTATDRWSDVTVPVPEASRGHGDVTAQLTRSAQVALLRLV